MLTADERDQMAHAIGHASATGCSVHGGRNHYVAPSDDPVWCGLADRGLARRRPSPLIPSDEAVFSVTRAGRDAVRRDPRSQPPPIAGRLYRVLFDGYPDCPIEVRATSNAKARYAAVQRVSDAWSWTTRELFARIVSCRLA